jgi:hypothetical protein
LGFKAWGDVVDVIAKDLHAKGAIKSAEVEHVPIEEASNHHPWAASIWGGNYRSRGDQLRHLGWKPTGPSIYDSLPAMMDEEIKLAKIQ